MPHWLILLIGLSLIGGVLLSLISGHSIRNFFLSVFLSSIPCFVVLMMLLCFRLASITADNPHYSLRYTETTQIYSLRTNELISGSFSLGCGSINDESYYIYYTQDSDGAYSINRLKASECKIYMDRDSGGQLVKVWGKLNDENLHKNWGWMEVIFSHNEFHLPHGSLIQEYSVR